MSHLSVLSAHSPTTSTSGDSGYYSAQPSSPVKASLELPDGFRGPARARSRSASIRPNEDGVQSLPASPVQSSFPQRPVFRRSATSSVTTASEAAKYDAMHYAQTHFSRSTLLVYPTAEHIPRIVIPQEKDEDIQELLLASSDEELSQPPSTPGLEARIPPRGSSASAVLNKKQSMESDKTSSSSELHDVVDNAPVPPFRRSG